MNINCSISYVRCSKFAGKPWHNAKGAVVVDAQCLFFPNRGIMPSKPIKPKDQSYAAHLRHPENVLSSNATQGGITLTVASSIAAARQLTINLLF